MPQEHKPNDIASLSDIQTDPTHQRARHMAAPWVVGAACLSMLLAGIALWPTGNDTTAAPPVVAERNIEATIGAQQKPQQRLALESRTMMPDEQRSVATIISITDPAGSADPKTDNLIGQSVAMQQTSGQSGQSGHPGQSAQAVDEKAHVTESHELGRKTEQTDTADSLLAKATPVSADSAVAVTPVNHSDKQEQNAPVVHMQKIHVLGTVPDSPRETGHVYNPIQVNADVVILATLMSYIETQDAPPTSSTTLAYMGMKDNNATPIILQHRLRNCAPANTVEGIQCRQKICKGHLGAVAACPAPKQARR